MKKTSAIFFLISILIHSGCNDLEVQKGVNDSNYIILDSVYIINPIKGFDSAEPIVTEVYLDGKYLGKTPITFTPEKRKELGLPDYETIEIDENRHWMTWDLNGPGELRLAHPKSRETKQILKLKKPKRYEQSARFTGMYGSPTETGGGMRLSVRLQKNDKRK